MNRDNPVIKTLSTPELVEVILSHLSIREILSAERVCFLWHVMVRKSCDLQSLKFIEPIKVSSGAERVQVVQRNPMYLQRFVQQAAFLALRDINPRVKFFGMDPTVIDKAQSFEDPAASWRHMYLYQPPVPAVVIEGIGARLDVGPFQLQNREGVKLGDVVTFFHNYAAGGSDSLIYVTQTATRKLLWDVKPLRMLPP